MFLAQRLPFMEDVAPLQGKATAYVCSDLTCKMPTTDSVIMQQMLEEYISRPTGPGERATHKGK